VAAEAYRRTRRFRTDAREIMPSEVPIARQLALRLVPREYTDTPDELLAAARDACESVSTDFSRWVGSVGYDALVARALSEARRAYPALALIHHQIGAEPQIAGIAECLERHGVDVTAQALVGMLEMIFTLLGRLIGDDLVTALVERSVESCSLDDRRNKRHLDSGSPSS
jgi:hypothetical protein